MVSNFFVLRENPADSKAFRMRSCGKGQRFPRSLETASPISARDASKSHAKRKNCLESRISRADEGCARKRAFGPAPDDTPNAPPKRLPTAIGCSHRASGFAVLKHGFVIQSCIVPDGTFVLGQGTFYFAARAAARLWRINSKTPGNIETVSPGSVCRMWVMSFGAMQPLNRGRSRPPRRLPCGRP